MISKKVVSDLLNFQGLTRGVVYQTDLAYILSRGGPEGLKKVEAMFTKLGYPFSYEKIQATKWFPAGLRVLSLLIIKEVFNLNDKDIYEMGLTAPKLSFFMKMFIRTFVSLDKVLENVASLWKEHHNYDLLLIKHDKVKKIITATIDGFLLYPIFCKYLVGYFKGVVSLIIQTPISIKETKCAFKGSKVHEFVINYS